MECQCQHQFHSDPTYDHAPGADVGKTSSVLTEAGVFLVCDHCKAHHFTTLGADTPKSQKLKQ